MGDRVLGYGYEGMGDRVLGYGLCGFEAKDKTHCRLKKKKKKRKKAMATQFDTELCPRLRIHKTWQSLPVMS